MDAYSLAFPKCLVHGRSDHRLSLCSLQTRMCCFIANCWRKGIDRHGISGVGKFRAGVEKKAGTIYLVGRVVLQRRIAIHSGRVQKLSVMLTFDVLELNYMHSTIQRVVASLLRHLAPTRFTRRSAGISNGNDAAKAGAS